MSKQREENEMIKVKVIAVTALLLFTAGGVFAGNFSVSAGGGGDVSYDLETDSAVYGFHGFVDITYLMVTAGINIVKKDVSFATTANLKYPINIGSSFSFFPTVGVEYRIAKKQGTFLLNAGAGMDFSIGNNAFARLTALYVFAPGDIKHGQITFRPSIGFRF